MGRVKLQIKKLEHTNGRQATYTKRKHGILKKANELSILCDINIILLMFSPGGKPSLCKGNHSIEEVIMKFAQLTPQERAKRKLESLEALKKTFKKLDHDVNISEFLGTSSQAVEELSNRSQLLQAQLSQVQQRLSCWTEIEKINSLDQLGQMESSIEESLVRIRAQKENLGKQQLMPLDYSSQLQRGMHFLSPTSWIPSNDGQQMVLPEEPNQLPQRDCECSGSSSFGSYSGFFCTDRGSDQLPTSIQEHVPNCGFNDSAGAASLRLQLSGQYQYAPYVNQNLQTDNKFQLPSTDMNLHQQFPVAAAFQANGGNFEGPNLGFDSTSCSWASGSGLYPVTMFDAHLYASNQTDVKESAATDEAGEHLLCNFFGNYGKLFGH